MIENKPTIYNTATIYNTGAGGGGGGGVDKNIFSSMFVSTDYREIVFDDTIEKNNLSILCSFCRYPNFAGRILKLYDSESNQIGQLFTNDGTNLFVNNQVGVDGDETALMEGPRTIIMNNSSYRSYSAGSYLNFNCPWSNGYIKKISFGISYILRFALYKGGIDINNNSQFLVDMRPSIVNGEKGMKDIVNNKFYKLEQVNVY